MSKRKAVEPLSEVEIEAFTHVLCSHPVMEYMKKVQTLVEENGVDLSLLATRSEMSDIYGEKCMFVAAATTPGFRKIIKATARKMARKAQLEALEQQLQSQAVDSTTVEEEEDASVQDESNLSDSRHGGVSHKEDISCKGDELCVTLDEGGVEKASCSPRTLVDLFASVPAN